jgi:hypothetical protein
LQKETVLASEKRKDGKDILVPSQFRKAAEPSLMRSAGFPGDTNQL